jgi:hypothetical protein
MAHKPHTYSLAPSSWARPLCLLVFVLTLFSIPSMALASNDEEFEELEKNIDLLSRLEWAFEPSEEDGLVLIPIAFSNPTIGSGVGGAARWRYRLDEEAEISHTTLGAGWAGADGWVVGLQQRTFLKGDQWHVNGVLGLFGVTRPHYGIGYDAGEQDDYIDLDQAGFLFAPEVLIRSGENLHMGLRYRLLQVETTSDSAEISSGGVFDIPADEQDALSSGIGPILRLDSRDSRYGPSSGALLDITSYVADQNLGSDFKYQTLKTEYSHYVTVGEEQVLALGLTGCFTSGDVPYYDLCTFGQKSNLRGYVAGQYRDRNMVSAQLEYRGQFYGRWGLVGFAGVGEVAPSVDELDGEDLLPSFGGGVRLMVSRKERINVGIDYAVGKDDHTFYLRFGEAF